jgi:hypothetical protein
MKESHGEGLASHTDPESCISDRKVADKAFDRGTCRPGIEPRNGNRLRGADADRSQRKATSTTSLAREVVGPRAVGGPEHVRNLSGGNREILGVSAP